MYISPKHSRQDDDWRDPIVNLDQFSHIQTAILDGGPPAIQFINQGGQVWVSWLYVDAESRDKEFKRLMKLLTWPEWFARIALTFGY